MRWTSGFLEIMKLSRAHISEKYSMLIYENNNFLKPVFTSSFSFFFFCVCVFCLFVFLFLGFSEHVKTITDLVKKKKKKSVSF